MWYRGCLPPCSLLGNTKQYGAFDGKHLTWLLSTCGVWSYTVGFPIKVNGHPIKLNGHPIKLWHVWSRLWLPGRDDSTTSTPCVYCWDNQRWFPRGTSKSSILTGFSIYTPFILRYPQFMENPISHLWWPHVDSHDLGGGENGWKRFRHMHFTRI